MGLEFKILPKEEKKDRALSTLEKHSYNIKGIKAMSRGGPNGRTVV